MDIHLKENKQCIYFLEIRCLGNKTAENSDIAMHISCTELRHNIQHSWTIDLYPETANLFFFSFWFLVFGFW